MHIQPELNEAEWNLIGQLLAREHDELPTEIHHTRNQAMRDELRQRRQMVESLLGKIRKMELV